MSFLEYLLDDESVRLVREFSEKCASMVIVPSFLLFVQAGLNIWALVGEGPSLTWLLPIATLLLGGLAMLFGYGWHGRASAAIALRAAAAAREDSHASASRSHADRLAIVRDYLLRLPTMAISGLVFIAGLGLINVLMLRLSDDPGPARHTQSLPLLVALFSIWIAIGLRSDADTLAVGIVAPDSSPSRSRDSVSNAPTQEARAQHSQAQTTSAAPSASYLLCPACYSKVVVVSHKPQRLECNECGEIFTSTS